ncbi:hypothetical protein [Sphingomonas sp.]|uniref:hypothetical protein n=1 Tax=Sphingomonas sp. TaxID=28214 RepID=UPI002C2726C0|nr:hypothetical protein [Sphingomonas sp.]HTG38633.1 hypothetical protein [Sphingomonas sp.]
MKQLTIAAALLLAACGSADDDSESNVSVAVPTAAPSPAAPTPEPTETPAPEPGPSETEAVTGAIDAIPAEWRGTWAGRDGCGQAATMRVDVEADRLMFYESEGRASEIERRAPREIALRLDMSGEGESWTRRATLALSADGERLTRTEAGLDPVTYTRCGS